MAVPVLLSLSKWEDETVNFSNKKVKYSNKQWIIQKNKNLWIIQKKKKNKKKTQLFSNSQSTKFSVHWLLFPYCCLSANELFVAVSKMKPWIIWIQKWNIQIKQRIIQINYWIIQKKPIPILLSHSKWVVCCCVKNETVNHSNKKVKYSNKTVNYSKN